MKHGWPHNSARIEPALYLFGELAISSPIGASPAALCSREQGPRTCLTFQAPKFCSAAVTGSRISLSIYRKSKNKRSRIFTKTASSWIYDRSEPSWSGQRRRYWPTPKEWSTGTLAIFIAASAGVRLKAAMPDICVNV